MEKAQLVLEYLDVLKWPVVLVVVLGLFRGRVQELLGRITEGEALGVKAKFQEQLREDLEELTDEPANAGSSSDEAPDAPANTRVPSLTVRIADVDDFVSVREAFDAADVVTVIQGQPDNGTFLLMSWSWMLGFKEALGKSATMSSLEEGKRFIIRHRDATSPRETDPPAQP